MNHCKTIAIVNQKGGVGKTTSTVNLGVGLAQAGNRVLLVDDDPQHSLTISLGIRNADDELDITLATAMQAEIRDESVPWEEGIIHSGEGVDLLPANIELSGVEMSLFNAMSREQVLTSVLSRVKENYDYILIDCMPSLGLMSINALVAADSVIIPSAPDFLSTKGLNLLIRTISRVRRQINPKLKIDGILAGCGYLQPPWLQRLYQRGCVLQCGCRQRFRLCGEIQQHCFQCSKRHENPQLHQPLLRLRSHHHHEREPGKRYGFQRCTGELLLHQWEWCFVFQVWEHLDHHQNRLYFSHSSIQCYPESALCGKLHCIHLLQRQQHLPDLCQAVFSPGGYTAGLFQDQRPGPEGCRENYEGHQHRPEPGRVENRPVHRFGLHQSYLRFSLYNRQ